MPSSQFKDFVKNFNPGRVIAVRLRRLAKNGRTQRGSTTTHHEGDHSISADILSEFPVPSFTLHSNSSLLVHPCFLARDPGLDSSIRSSQGGSFARKASDMAQTFLPFVKAISDAIPLVGAPIKATIGGLLEIFEVMDVRVVSLRGHS